MRIRKAGCLALIAAAAGLLYSVLSPAGDGGFHGEASFHESSRMSLHQAGAGGRQMPGTGDSGHQGIPGTGNDGGLDRDSYEPQTEEVQIAIPDVKGTYTFLWVSDLHLSGGAGDPDVSPEHREESQARYEMYRSKSGRASEETWKLLSGWIDAYGADGVIFGGDLLDYVSEENLGKLREGFESIRTPWMYLRADHDYGRWYSDMGIRRMRKLHRSVAPQNELWTMRFEDFIVAGLDNTTTAVKEETLEEFRRLCGEGLPVILCTHVPFDSGQNDAPSLAELSRECWEDKVLCWGDGDAYDTSDGGCMKQLLEIITAPESPVCAVLAGHLHAAWEGMLTDSCIGHVFSPAFDGRVGVITVSGLQDS